MSEPQNPVQKSGHVTTYVKPAPAQAPAQAPKKVKEPKPAVPTAPYFRLAALSATDGHERPNTEATSYVYDVQEWNALRSVEYGKLREYMDQEDTRRAKIEQAARVAREQAKLAAMEKK
jgi:O6-methylguanine-DNA--protein-cysteine methyltransferase